MKFLTEAQIIWLNKDKKVKTEMKEKLIKEELGSSSSWFLFDVYVLALTQF